MSVLSGVSSSGSPQPPPFFLLFFSFSPSLPPAPLCFPCLLFIIFGTRPLSLVQVAGDARFTSAAMLGRLRHAACRAGCPARRCIVPALTEPAVCVSLTRPSRRHRRLSVLRHCRRPAHRLSGTELPQSLSLFVSKKMGDTARPERNRVASLDSFVTLTPLTTTSPLPPSPPPPPPGPREETWSRGRGRGGGGGGRAIYI